jgi:cation:H+ antiporter
MVFQSTLPVAIGLSFTGWELDSYSILAGCLALAGGLVAILTLQIRRRFSGRAIVLWALLYAAFVPTSWRRHEQNALGGVATARSA